MHHTRGDGASPGALIARILKDPEAQHALAHLREDGLDLSISTPINTIIRLGLTLFAFSDQPKRSDAIPLIQKWVKQGARTHNAHDNDVSALLSVARHAAGKGDFELDATALKSRRSRRRARSTSSPAKIKCQAQAP
jgi:hypothetical protein